MTTEIFRNADNTSVLVIHQPGNMTKYVGTAFKIQNGPGFYKNNWAVSFPMGGGSFIFEEKMHLHWGYVMEKMGQRSTGGRQQQACISEMTKMIAMMVPGTTVTACTDDTGHLTEEEILRAIQTS